VTAALYVDTSALAKWYVNEARSEEFDAFITRQEQAAISRLTVVELRCLIARKRRSREIDSRAEKRALQTFEADVRAGYLTVYPLEDQHALAADDLIARLKSHPLRTLDALHLAIARALGVEKVATADRIMAAAVVALGIEVVRFD
jgi:predicted nucleic acid-binding protein